MSELVIDFKNTGAVEAMHMDGFDLGFLGDKKVRRQTDIVFAEDAQDWNLHYQRGDGSEFLDPTLNGFVSYEVARSFEVRWLNACRLTNTKPDSEAGLCVMALLRKPTEDTGACAQVVKPLLTVAVLRAAHSGGVLPTYGAGDLRKVLSKHTQ